MEDKNLDRLFQEKLKSLEATPNEKVWSAIGSKLKNKKPIVSPVWWFSSGIVAVFILGFLLFPFSENPVLENKTNKKPVIVVAPEINTDAINSVKKEIDTPFKKKKNQENIIITESKPTIKNNEKTEYKKQQPFKNSNILVAEEKVKQTKSKSSVSKKAMEKIFLTDNLAKDSVKSEYEKQQLFKNSKTLIAERKEQAKQTKIKSAIIEKAMEENFSNETFTKNEKVKTDSISSKTKKSEIKKPKKEFFAVIKEEENKEKKSTEKQWSLTPVFAVINSNSLSNTSPIDETLSKSTQGNSTYSYGIQVSYQLDSNWSIQSGVHLQEMGFSNNNIAVISSSLDNPKAIAFGGNEFYTFQNLSSKNFDVNSLSLNSLKSYDGNLYQKYGYVEIPLEIKYNLLKSKKLNTQIVVGFSSLFLNKNEIDLNIDSFSRLGKANNLNNINFSGNLGFDLNYNFIENWSLNLNPMIKTQLNTFSNNANDFKPYFVGIYTGISYRF